MPARGSWGFSDFTTWSSDFGGVQVETSDSELRKSGFWVQMECGMFSQATAILNLAKPLLVLAIGYPCRASLEFERRVLCIDMSSGWDRSLFVPVLSAWEGSLRGSSCLPGDRTRRERCMLCEGILLHLCLEQRASGQRPRWKTGQTTMSWLIGLPAFSGAATIQNAKASSTRGSQADN